ncbi:MAG: hypothetical protein AB1817_09645 [Chloroflexota bacterium]
MFKKIFLLGTLLILSVMSATACQGIPDLALQPTSLPEPAAAPTLATAAPATPPPAQAKPQLPDRSKVEGALRLADLSGGVVTENKNGALTLRLAQRQTQHIQTNASTIVVVPGKTNAQVADIRVGDRVIVDYGGDTTNTTAAFLLDLPADYNTGNVLLGAVMATQGETLNVRTRTGNDRVVTGSQTTFVNLSGDKPALGAFKDLKQGNVVVVIGQDTTDAFNAQIIVIADKDARAILNRGGRNQPAPTPTPKPGA